ncbi:hypothetical protein BY458DRAFT_448401, partial [Sporodiniella umbellata]
HRLETFGYSIQTKRTCTDQNATCLSLIEASKKTRIDVRLTSLLQLRKEIKNDQLADITTIFQNHTFIGCIDNSLALIQYGQDIYTLFYQIALAEFCNMGELKLSRPVCVKKCILKAIENERNAGNFSKKLEDEEKIASKITHLLLSKAQMLEEYYSLKLSSNGFLESLPMMIRNYIPPLDKLPLFLLRLGTEVDWDEEKNCFKTFSKELALFYCADPLEANEEDQKNFLNQVQHYIFPCFKSHFIATTTMKNHVLQVANLSDLYRIFERC